ncbi:hypothetical protein Bbelb_406020 [Branchiostoma belcheri]|nr:hypothetical protein Bbelb_406020 [Branchiostoma belcheri]
MAPFLRPTNFCVGIPCLHAPPCLISHPFTSCEDGRAKGAEAEVQKCWLTSRSRGRQTATLTTQPIVPEKTASLSTSVCGHVCDMSRFDPPNKALQNMQLQKKGRISPTQHIITQGTLPHVWTFCVVTMVTDCVGCDRQHFCILVTHALSPSLYVNTTGPGETIKMKDFMSHWLHTENKAASSSLPILTYFLFIYQPALFFWISGRVGPHIQGLR